MSGLPPVGILLLQLGTPDAPTAGALRRYLHEFLRDRRVIDLSPLVWWPVLYLAVLPRRPARSASLYRRIWTPDGSPLAVTTRAQAEGLKMRLTAAGGDVRVAVGMRYGRPSIAMAVEELVAAGCDRILALPQYPQYAGATTGSSLERLFEILGRRRVVPAVRVVPPYFASPDYIRALAATTREALDGWTPDHVVLSFHGIPKRYADLGDPYPDHCRATAQALVAEMGWPQDRVTMSFQSLFGREEWLRPYTDETLRALAGRRVRRLAMLCPGFTADCLETLEEMGMTNRELYEAAGGGEYRLVPCLNAHPAWIDAMTSIVTRELQGWDAQAPAAGPAGPSSTN